MKKLTEAHPDYELIRRTVAFAWRRVGLPHLFYKTRVFWVDLSTRDREAEANFYGFEYMHIHLDPKVWKNESIDGKRAAIAHEVCHLALIARLGRRAWRRPHSREFFKLLRKTGVLAIEKRLYYRGRYHALLNSVAR